MSGDGIVVADLHVRSWVDSHQVHWLHRTADVITDVLSPPVDLLALGLYAAISRRVRFRDALAVAAVMTAALAVTTIVAASLVYVDAHWLSDVLASYALSTIVLWGVAVTRPASAR